MVSLSRRIFCLFNHFKYLTVKSNNISGRYFSNYKLTNLKQTSNELNIVPNVFKDVGVENDNDSSSFICEYDNNSALQECTEDISHIAPYQSPSFNVASFVNNSYTLQQLVLLGVNLSKIETKKDVCEAILKLDFNQDIKKFLLFLQDLKVNSDEYGQIITKAPHILLQDLDNLLIRVNYLESKNFLPEHIIRIITLNPNWLTFTTQDIDYRLGFIQMKFNLNGNEVRFVATKMPKLITYKLGHIKKNMFSIKEEMGFTPRETKSLLLKAPKIYLLNQESLISRFDYLHNVMKISHHQLLSEPLALCHRKKRIQERHEFLTLLKKDQFNPKLPGYISLETLLFGNDVHFCSNVAYSSVDTYNKFLKTR